jgi:hypothetical protein
MGKKTTCPAGLKRSKPPPATPDKTYRIIITGHCQTAYRIKAKNADEAECKALDKFTAGNDGDWIGIDVDNRSVKKK